MSTNHGETVMQKSISEVAKYIKNLIPANIPEAYALKPRFESVASEDNIRNGVIAFRDFLCLLCDRLIADGHLYAQSKKTKNPTDYPFLHHVNHLLIDIGYHGSLSESGDSLLITEIPLFAALKPRISAPKQIECLRFLALCGFVFTGIDLEAKALDISEAKLLEVSYPKNPVMLMGLKAMSIADMELRTSRRYWNDDNLLRCDYRLLKAEDTEALDILKDYIHPLPKGFHTFALELHQRYIDMGMTCATNISTFNARIAYSNIKKSRRALSTREVYDRREWEFAFSIRHGNCLVVRAKKTDTYTDVIENFPLPLQQFIAKGYGCDRKLRNERCQGGCQGIRIPLDDSILEMKRDIEIWLDKEASC
jgi:hypothetical protein